MVIRLPRLYIYNGACNHDDGGDVFIFQIVNIPFSSRNNLTSYIVSRGFCTSLLPTVQWTVFQLYSERVQ